MSGKIFINYRRGEDSGFAGRLYDRLQQAFSDDQLFLDVDNIPPGHDFVAILEEQVANCDVFLSLIGRQWLLATDEAGQRRLNHPDDFVRIEIGSALKEKKCVIPVLIGNATMPPATELPEDIKPLVRRQSVRLTHERFNADTEGLVTALKSALASVENHRRFEQKAHQQATVSVRDPRKTPIGKKAAQEGEISDTISDTEANQPFVGNRESTERKHPRLGIKFNKNWKFKASLMEVFQKAFRIIIAALLPYFIFAVAVMLPKSISKYNDLDYSNSLFYIIYENLLKSYSNYFIVPVSFAIVVIYTVFLNTIFIASTLAKAVFLYICFSSIFISIFIIEKGFDEFGYYTVFTFSGFFFLFLAVALIIGQPKVQQKHKHE